MLMPPRLAHAPHHVKKKVDSGTGLWERGGMNIITRKVPVTKFVERPVGFECSALCESFEVEHMPIYAGFTHRSNIEDAAVLTLTSGGMRATIKLRPDALPSPEALSEILDKPHEYSLSLVRVK
jgi:hypothetical protein